MVPSHPAHDAVLTHIARKRSLIFIPSLVVAEIEFGLQTAKRPLSDAAESAHAEVRQFMADYPQREFGEFTVEPYSLIRAEVWRQNATLKASGRGYKEKHPEELIDRVTGLEIGIDEKDLQIAAIAVEYNCYLATVDRNAKMLRIEAAANALRARGEPVNLRVDDWSKPI